MSVPVAEQRQDTSGEGSHRHPSGSMHCEQGSLERSEPQEDFFPAVSVFFESFPSGRTCRVFTIEWRREAVVGWQATTLLL